MGSLMFTPGDVAIDGKSDQNVHVFACGVAGRYRCRPKKKGEVREDRI